MKKLTIILIVLIMSVSMFVLVACDNKDIPDGQQEVDNNQVQMGQAAAFDDYEYIADITKLTSDVDKLNPTNMSYLKVEPYGSIGYTLRGWMDEVNHPAELIVPATYNGKPIVEIEREAFFRDDKLISVKMGSNVRFIGKSAFRECPNLATVVLGPNVENIKASAFRDSTSITEITIPLFVKYLAANTFSGCTSLATVNFPKKYYTETPENGDPYDVYLGVENFAVKVFYNCTSLTSIELPETLETIGSGAFYNSGLVELVIPFTVENVGMLSFAECSDLSVTVYGNNTTYEDSSFLNCKNVNFA